MFFFSTVTKIISRVLYSLVSSTQQDKIQVFIKQRLCSINIVIAMHEMKVIMMCK